MLCFRCGSYNVENASKCSVCGQEFVDAEGRAVGPIARKASQTSLQSAAIFAVGELVAGRYKIVELIGQGGVGAVYRARDTEIDVDVALKGIAPNLLQTDEEQKNFSKAIKAARKLQHQNIVRIYDEGHEGARRFFTMKLLEGLTLRKIIRLRHDKQQAFTVEELIPILHQMASALDYAHKTTWHGDLKPENILVLPDLLKVTDFNLVKALPLKPFLGIAKTRSKAFPYIAPELRVEASSIDGRVDIYSLGVILAEMLTGLVYEGHFTRAFTAALEQLPTKLDGLIRRALSDHPDGRFARAGDMARETEQVLATLGNDGLPPPARPAKGEPQTSLPPKAAANPPPPPSETNPSQSMSPPPMAEPSEEDESMLEIGQSQVMLLESGSHAAAAPGNKGPKKKGRQKKQQTQEDLAVAARQLLAARGSNDDTIDERSLPSSDEIDTAPRGRPAAAERPVERGQLGDTDSAEPPQSPPPRLSSDEAARNLEFAAPELDDLRPPPLPEFEMALERSLDPPVALPGDEEELPTLTAGGQMPEPARPEGRAGLAIHDALTALKMHPRPDLIEDKELRDAVTKTGVAGTPGPSPPSSALPPPLEPVRPVDIPTELRPEVRQPPRPVEQVPPPLVAPTLRPVVPPRRPGNGPKLLFIAAGATLGIAALFVGIRFALTDVARGTDKPPLVDVDVKVGVPPDSPERLPPDRVPSTLADAGFAVVSKPAGDPAPSTPTLVPDAGTNLAMVEEKTPAASAPAVVALAGGQCPKGMASIPGGPFLFGSAADDVMRNFGEIDATQAEARDFCIDYYEAPNGKDDIPTTGVTWQAAKNACERAGKRLCTEPEWERACKGPGNERFPYGGTFDATICNTQGADGKPRELAAAIAFKKCRSAFKVFSLAGNAEEWVLDAAGAMKVAKGGAADRPDFASRCSARRALPGKTTSPTLGFRCCADPK